MSNRLDQEREKRLEPTRLEYALGKIKSLGYDTYHDGKKITFYYKEALITFYPYSGWASGKTITDGRGLEKLLNQIKQQ